MVWLQAALLFLRLALTPVQRISEAIEVPFVVLGVAASSYVGQLISSIPAAVFPLAMITALSVLAGVRLQLQLVPKLSVEGGNADEFQAVGPRSGAEPRARLTLLKVRNLSSVEARRCRVQLVRLHPSVHSIELPRLLRWRGEGGLETDIPGHGVGFVVIAGAEGSALEDPWRMSGETALLVTVSAWADGSRADVKQFKLEAANGWEWPAVSEVPAD